VAESGSRVDTRADTQRVMLLHDIMRHKCLVVHRQLDILPSPSPPRCQVQGLGSQPPPRTTTTIPPPHPHYHHHCHWLLTVLLVWGV
jgi:hypothetical protein